MFPSELREFPSAPCLAGGRGELDDSSRFDVVEIARVLDMLPRFFPFWSVQGLISTIVMITDLGRIHTRAHAAPCTAKIITEFVCDYT